MSTYDSLHFQPMLIADVFESMKAAGKWFDLSKATWDGDLKHPYVARSGGDNGIVKYLPHQGFNPPNEGNAITIGVSTSTVFYQPVAFYTSKEIQVLRHPPPYGNQRDSTCGNSPRANGEIPMGQWCVTRTTSCNPDHGTNHQHR